MSEGSAAVDRQLAPSAGHWWAVALRGVAAVLFGLMALLWPGITLFALVLLFGVYALVDGAFTLVAAIRDRDAADTGPGGRGWLIARGRLRHRERHARRGFAGYHRTGFALDHGRVGRGDRRVRGRRGDPAAARYAPPACRRSARTNGCGGTSCGNCRAGGRAGADALASIGIAFIDVGGVRPELSWPPVRCGMCAPDRETSVRDGCPATGEERR
jgi:hypothetical protein